MNESAKASLIFEMVPWSVISIPRLLIVLIALKSPLSVSSLVGKSTRAV